ncbi:MAG: ATP-binding protein [Chthoniobacteraceae bacterium]
MDDIKRMFACEPEALAEVRTFVRAFLEQEKIEKCEAELLVLGINEAYANVIRHSGGAQEEVEVSCARDGETLRFRLRDFGVNPADPARFRRRPLEEVAPGGLGLHLIERVFDAAVYRPQTPGTELELTKVMPAARAV